MDDADDWVRFNPLTMTVGTKDGTKVAAELFYGPESLAGYLRIAEIRAEQRAAMKPIPSQDTAQGSE